MTTPEPRPRVSVCIANYNGEALLDDCIGSVLAQDIDAVIEIIVHDDASTDGSLDLLAARHPRVRVIASAENVGFCVANNRMADIACGEYLLLLNNDAALDAGALRTLLSDAALIGGDAILTLPQYDWDTGTLVDRGCLLDPFYNPVPNLDPDHADVAYVIGACLWIPRRLWHELGGFPEWFGSLAEDMHLCCVARLRNIPVRCARDSGYRHRQGASFGGNRAEGGLRTTYRRRALSERNKTTTMLACTPWQLLWLQLPLHLTALAAESIVLACRRHDPRIWHDIYWPAISVAFDARSPWHELRRVAQAHRRASLREWLGGFIWMPRKLSLLRRHGMPELR